jgi:Patatin phospholipase
MEDVKMLDRFNEVAELMEALEKLPGGNLLAGNPAYEAVKKRAYVHVPRIVSITPPAEVDQFDDGDFSPEAMKTREEKGYAETKKVLGEGGGKAG